MKIIIALSIIGIILFSSCKGNDNAEKLKRKTDLRKEIINNANPIFFHEDDYRQVELRPSEHFKELVTQTQNVQDFADQNTDGIGYTNIVVRKENKYQLKERGIKLTEIDALLSKYPIERYTVVSTGIRPGEMISKNTYGYGKNHNAIFVQYESKIVTSIWIAGTPLVADGQFAQILYEIGAKWGLLLMDWNALDLIDLKNETQIKSYLQQ